jgi:hypothetical protein
MQMKTLNEYGSSVVDAQASVDAIAAQIEAAHAGLQSLQTDKEAAEKVLSSARDELKEATARILSGDYGIETDELPDPVPPVPIETETTDRTHAGNGAGF